MLSPEEIRKACEDCRAAVDKLDRAVDRLAETSKGHAERLKAVEHAQSEVISLLRERVTEIQHIVVGVDGRNGLRGQIRDFIKKSDEAQAEMRKTIHKMMGAVGLAIILIPVGVWMIDRMGP